MMNPCMLVVGPLPWSEHAQKMKGFETTNQITSGYIKLYIYIYPDCIPMILLDVLCCHLSIYILYPIVILCYFSYIIIMTSSGLGSEPTLTRSHECWLNDRKGPGGTFKVGVDNRIWLTANTWWILMVWKSIYEATSQMTIWGVAFSRTSNRPTRGSRAKTNYRYFPKMVSHCRSRLPYNNDSPNQTDLNTVAYGWAKPWTPSHVRRNKAL